jgi:hypothetical protein
VFHYVRHSKPRTVVFGAFDRHNLGDLLFPHIAARLLPGRELIYAGLAERDLRPFGGHLVRPLAALASELGDTPVELIHVGGELLGCDAWQAAVMLQTPEQAATLIARLDADPVGRRDFAARCLGMADQAPYAVARSLFRGAVRVSYNAVGGVELGTREPTFRREVFAKLATADRVTVRDRETQVQLAAAGIAADLLPDPAMLVAVLFGELIAERVRSPALAALRTSFPQGYLAVQFAAEFGDESSLDLMAQQVDEIVRATGYGLVLFRAGAAPWHDELPAYQRLVRRLKAGTARIFDGLEIWDLCALIAASRGFCGSSLHGRLLAVAYALPRLNLRPPGTGQGPSKHEAFAACWEDAGLPGVVALPQLAAGCQTALASDPAARRHTAQGLAERYRRSFATNYPASG